eukprot:CAMPEP_0172505202 /NCGR_PEP_ID=MMETSP1066-20121228/184384_1 /TAXON_ID=671091 /ORGANISM="Coscinodiscus wailesii, Strain CCMP2513" /LENGTH=475 /DNA_ID=CAMNT_0013281715 /DNA_START=104 /DNA_END=1528 /DNA_ORIENTATION=+
MASNSPLIRRRSNSEDDDAINITMTSHRSYVRTQSNTEDYDVEMNNSYCSDDSEYITKHDKGSRSHTAPSKLAIGGAALIFLFLLILLIYHKIVHGWWGLFLSLCCPIAVIGYVAFGKNAKSLNNLNARIVAFGFLASICGTQCPKFITACISGVGLVAFGLAMRPAQNNNVRVGMEKISSSGQNLTGDIQGVLAALVLTTMMLTENFFVWVVSATYDKSHDGGLDPEPLQDNGRIIFSAFSQFLGLTKYDLQNMRDLINVQWALVAALAGSLVACQLNFAGKRTLVGIAVRSMYTLACVRAIRTVSFLLTVLPSQVPNCYLRHFPIPPSTWKEWLLVGLIPSSRGGCNDLIISGHATVTSTMACASTSIADNLAFSTSVWILLTFDYFIEVIQGLHYSVDMWLGAIVTSLIWRLLGPLEQKAPKEEKDLYLMPLSSATATDIIQFSIPAVIAVIAITVLPNSIANLWIVLGVIW